ncbi:MAG: DUF6159 family protein [Bryobacteraceae bacterium]
MDRFSRGWQLFKESFAVLAGDAEILVFPLCSGFCLLLLGVSFFVPLYRDGTLQAVAHRQGKWDDYAVLFAWYYLNYFVGIFFNSALMGCANMRLSGQRPTVGAGFQLALGKVGRIAAWALVAASVGVVLSFLRDRRSKLLSFAVAGLNMAWSLITFLAVPVLLFEDHGVFGSLHRSQQLFRKNWGAQVAGSFGFGMVTTLFCIPAVLLAIFGFRYDPGAAIILAVVYILILATVMSAVRGVFTVALYRYASAGTAPAGFTPGTIDGALGGRSFTA